MSFGFRFSLQVTTRFKAIEKVGCRLIPIAVMSEKTWYINETVARRCIGAHTRYDPNEFVRISVSLSCCTLSPSTKPDRVQNITEQEKTETTDDCSM